MGSAGGCLAQEHFLGTLAPAAQPSTPLGDLLLLSLILLPPEHLLPLLLSLLLLLPLEPLLLHDGDLILLLSSSGVLIQYNS